MVFDWETSLIITLWWYYLHWNQFVYIYICSQSIWILVYNSGSFNDVYVTCYVAMRKPCRPSRLADRNWLKTGSKLETLLRRPRDAFQRASWIIRFFESFYVFRYVQSAYMRLFTSLPTFACNQVLRAKLKDLWAVIPTMSLWYGVAGPMSNNWANVAPFLSRLQVCRWTEVA